MQDHAHNFLTFIFTCVTIVIGHVFDVPPATLLAAGIGAGFGVAFSGEIHPFKAFLLIGVGTISIGFVVPFFISAWPNLAQKSVAFLIAFILIGFRKQLRENSPRLIEAGFKAGEVAIGRLATMFNKTGGN